MDLLKHYDDEFSRNYDRTEQMDRNIMTKGRMVNINQDSYERKKFWVTVILHLIYFTLWVVFIGLMRQMDIMGDMTYWIMFVIGMLYLFYQLFIAPSLRSIYNFIRNFRVRFRIVERDVGIFLSETILPSFLRRRECPPSCRPKGEPPTGENDFETTVDNELRTDSSLNDWRDGDKPEATWGMRDTEEKRRKNMPQPWYSGVSNAREYRCVWDGVSGGKLKGQPEKMRTTIPCEYYPGYKVE